MRVECINTRGEVTVIRTFGFYDTNLTVHLFSPQSYFLQCLRKNGKFTISWSKAFLELDQGEIRNNMRITDILP